jgi:hypothetical protein
MTVAAALVTGVLAAAASTTAVASVTVHVRALCGVERWTVKTLQDRPSLFPVRTVTLRFLVTRPPPASLPVTRLPFERQIYRVVAAVTLVRPEDDGDYHLVLRDQNGRTMIAETPALVCTVRATPLRRAQMQTVGMPFGYALEQRPGALRSSTTTTGRRALPRTPSSSIRCSGSAVTAASAYASLESLRPNVAVRPGVRRRLDTPDAVAATAVGELRSRTQRPRVYGARKRMQTVSPAGGG